MTLIKTNFNLWPSHFNEGVLPDPRISDGICFGFTDPDVKIDFVFVPTADGRAFKCHPECSGYDIWKNADNGTEFAVEMI